MMPVYDQIERALDSVLDGVLNKTIRTVAWLVDLGNNQDEDIPIANLPDIVKDIHKASAMTFPDLVPDHIASTPATSTSTTSYKHNYDGATKRCKSLDDICTSSSGTNTNYFHHHHNHNSNNSSHSSCIQCNNNTGHSFHNESSDHRTPHTLQLSTRQNHRTAPPGLIYRQESCPGETDIELEPQTHDDKQSSLLLVREHRRCQQCCSNPLPLPRHVTRPTPNTIYMGLIQTNNTPTTPNNNNNNNNNTSNNNNRVSGSDSEPKQSVDNSSPSTPGLSSSSTDYTDNNSTVQRHPVVDNDSRLPSLDNPQESRSTQERVAAVGDAPIPPTRSDLERERTKRRIQRRATELIFKHFPEVQQSGELERAGDEQLCHSIVSELKTIADNFDAKRSGKDGMSELQGLAKLFLPSTGWITQGIIAPAVLKTTLDLALQFYKL